METWVPSPQVGATVLRSCYEPDLVRALRAAQPRAVHAGAGAAILVTLVISACSSGDSDALTSRELQRELESICADEVDIRHDDGSAAEDGRFLSAGMEGDNEAALEAADYNIEALDRVAAEVADLEAEDPADGEALEAAVDSIGARQAAWEDRSERLSSGELELSEDTVVEVVHDGGPALNGWLDALEHLGVDYPDCGLAVP